MLLFYQSIQIDFEKYFITLYTSRLHRGLMVIVSQRFAAVFLH